jgi:tetratricopeptide (TPR) repeat protein
MRFAVFAIALTLAVGCHGSSDRPAPVPSAPPSASAAPRPGVCPDGKSMDPPSGELRTAMLAFRNKDYAKAQQSLDAMARRFPNSASVQVWRGDATLFDKALTETAAADAAIPYYHAAEKLHDGGCKLEDYEQYYLRMDLAYAHLRKSEPDPALTELALAEKQWPDSAEVYYHQARAYCLKEDVDRCADEFEKALGVAKSLKRPRFLRTHHSLADWIQRSRTQSEFGPLRKDRRYPQIIARVRKP